MKQNFVKRICSGVMALVMLLSLVPATAFAQETDSSVSEDAAQTVVAATPAEVPAEIQEAVPAAVAETGDTEQIPESSDATEETQEAVQPVTSGDVTTAEELEAALAAGWTSIRITADFTVDRTFYVVKSTAVYTEEAHTLTRAADFAGDMFVVGETPEGTICQEQVILTLGDPASEAENLLVIDGNMDNLTVGVNGTVVFVCGGHRADLYTNVTIRNNKKTGNDRSMNREKYLLSSYPDKVGGAAGIVAESGTINIFGGNYSNNQVNTGEEDLSSWGGAFFNHGTMHVYGGVFENGIAHRAGAFYNYRRLYLYNGIVRNNTASLSGAIYLPASGSSKLYIGTENDIVENGKVVFSGNRSESTAGVFNSQSVNTVTVENAEFSGNTAASHGGAILAQGNVQIANSIFRANETDGKGGAIYTSGEGSTLTVTGCTFEENTAGSSGGAIHALSEMTITDSRFSGNTSSAGGGAVYIKGAVAKITGTTFENNEATAGHGGAIGVNSPNANEENVDLMMVDVELRNNTSYLNGGAMYVSDGARVYMREAAFTRNTALGSADSAYGGGAIYATNGKIEINYGSFDRNVTNKRGGALSLFTTSEVVLNNVTANGNSAEEVGGFACANKSDLTIYNSRIEYSSAPSGGAIEYQAGSSGSLYNTVFNGNTAVTTGGAIHIPAGETSTVTGEATTFLMHSCQFTNNRATAADSSGQGGAVRTTSKTQLEMYNTVAYNNYAYRGGFYYTTTTGTNTTISGLTVYGNTAGDGGPIIWSNSAGVKIYMNKANHEDRAVTGELDDAYWTSLVANQPSVLKDSDAAVPEYTDYLPPAFDPDAPNQPQEPEEPVEPEDPGLGVVDVATAQELADALATDKNNIRITADITLDRSYYITRNITIFSEEAHTLTRAADFAGDLFVVGQAEDSSACSGTVVLTLGDDRSAEKDLLTVNGNSENMTVDVTGSVLAVCGNANVNLYENVTVTNCAKSGDGAVALLTGNGALNVYGGSYTSNSATGSGGVVSSCGTVTVYSGTFLGNSADKGGAVHSTGKVLIHSGDFLENTAVTGGAVYTTGKLTTYGGSFTGNNAANGGAVYAAGCAVDSGSTGFSGNTATENGGAICVSSGSVTVKDATFQNNTAAGNGGAVCMDGGSISAEEALFHGNTADGNGGAVFVSGGEATAVNTTFSDNVAENNGGAVYLLSSQFASEAGQMTGNRATYGGAIYAKTGSCQINGTELTNNISDYYGGAVALFASSNAELTGVVADGNTAVYAGGFLYNQGSTLHMADSQVQNNASDRTGGALAMNTGAVTTVEDTAFTDNTAASNGGAIYAVTGGTVTDLTDCTFARNEAEGNGGAVYAGSASVVNISKAAAQDNKADRGAVLYETDRNTTVTIDGITVSGNAAATSGDVIYGANADAVLNIDKSDYTDSSAEQIDAEYWSSAIVNKVTVNDISDPAADLEEEDIGGMTNVVKVTSAKQLEAALNSGRKYIRVAEDFSIDRTFYITYDVTIFSTDRRVLTRDPGFGGDIFVVGEDHNGNSVLNTSKAILTLGNPNSKTQDLLVIDGNRDHMNVQVNGTVLFMAYSAQVDLYPNVTIQNAYKQGNERVLNEVYTYSDSFRAGGAMAMVMSGSLNIYGGTYRNNRTSDYDTAAEKPNSNTYGGAIFNYSNVNIYGGTFSGNQAHLGGMMYSYRITRIYGGSFIGNTSGSNGGAIYCPSSTACHTIIGSKDANGSQVLFEGNTATSNAGAITSGALSSLLIYGNITFKDNVALGNNAGAIYTSGQMTLQGVTFEGNQCASKGGAVYVCNDTAGNVTRYVEITDCVFEENSAPRGGALGIYASSAELAEGGIVTVTDCQFNANRSEGDASVIQGGAIYIERKSELNITGSTFTGNSTENEAGALYIAGDSDVTISDTSFAENTAAGNAGAISIHSATLNLSNVTMEQNTTGANGAALYISYSSGTDMNSKVTLTDSELTGNGSTGNGGAIYVTKQTVTKEKQILTVRNTDFAYNHANGSGGAVMLQPGVDVYMYKTTFLQNSAANKKGLGGAIYSNGGILEIDDAVFSQNEAATGGAIQLSKESTAVLNNVTAARNSASSEGGFAHVKESALTIYSSSIKNNNATGGGALYGLTGAVTKVYDTVIEGNRASNNAGAVYVYTDADTLLQNCTVSGNTAGGNGGAFYVSQAGTLTLYNVQARNNTATLGGVAYETVANTTIIANGLTVSGNTATNKGPIFLGNHAESVLKLNKTNYVDEDVTEELTEEYWAGAVANKVTLIEITDPIPDYKPYAGQKDQEETPPETKEPVPVTDVFDLSKSSSDADINDVYAAFPKLDNSSNFMSRNTSAYENVCGGTVTVDTFVSYSNDPDGNGQVGLGLLIFQAMQYKQAHPEEEVYIDVSAYRLSTQCAVNINRDSRYFGYMRDLQDREYDEYGFVRIVYLLVSAAKMGIHVTAIGQLDGYPRVSSALNLSKYFTNKLNDPCDPAYSDGVIGDYLNFQFCYWTLDEKGGTDMMHTKMCAVSHYLDMNGVAHRNALWTSSSNIDGITAKGCNANNNLQTSTIITNHPDLYRVASNYLRLIADHCGQEQIFAFQDTVNTRSKQQIDLINAGKENQIPADQQIVYLGGKDDDVFELYFTPFGGNNNVWEEAYNPYSKYLQKLYDSEDYILFTWSVASFSSAFPLGKQVENAIIDAFHTNKNPKNKIYLLAGGFDTAAFDDLKVGVDIGYKSLNKKAFGSVHNKDVQVSYVENGQRYFVTLHNSLNFHNGSMAYQSNFVLVIKDKTCAEGSVFSTFANLTTSGDIAAHTFGKWVETLAPTADALGEETRECAVCGKKEVRHIDANGDVVDPDPSDPDKKNPFEDVAKADYFYDPVLWAFHNGITTGSDATHFNPNGECTRAQAVTFLWRAAGEPKPISSENPFKDVAEGSYYYDAVLWAVEQGITNGVSADSFAPDASCTRGQIVTFLWRYAYCPAPTSMNNPFSDTDADAYYGKAMLWAVEEEITNGFPDGTFGPDQTCTRGQIVTFLYRAIAA